MVAKTGAHFEGTRRINPGTANRAIEKDRQLVVTELFTPSYMPRASAGRSKEKQRYAPVLHFLAVERRDGQRNSIRNHNQQNLLPIAQRRVCHQPRYRFSLLTISLETQRTSKNIVFKQKLILGFDTHV